jgi:undecaprenyl-diphosphatase
MTPLYGIILGVIEGLTEFLPISSTAHLILASKVLNIFQSDFVKSFEIVIQFGAILAVVFLYWKKVLPNKEIIKRILAAFVPTAIVGFVLYKIIKGFLMSNLMVIVWALILGGVAIIFLEHWHKEKENDVAEIEKMSYRQCVTVGLAQAVAMVPGVSRAAATIFGGLLSGIKRKTIVEFSFLLAAPIMLAASGYDLFKSGFNFSVDQFGVLAFGFVTSFLVAIVAVKFLLRYIQKHNFVWFGIYRILIGLLFLLLILN